MVKHQRVSKYYYLDCRCFFDVLYHVKFIFCCLANLLTIFWGFSILFPPKKRCALLSLLVLNMMRWILQEFSFTEFALKLFKKHSKLKLRLWTISSNIFPHELIHQQNYIYQILRLGKCMPFMKTLNNKESKVDPGGISQIILHQSLKLESIFTFCSYELVL